VLRSACARQLLTYGRMYAPTHFQQDRPEVLQQFMERYPLAGLVGTSAKGILANHVPLIYEATHGTPGTLRGHIARANSMWRELTDGAEVLAIFQGASHYISPSWYPSKPEHGKVVPTWNYTVVHARGRITWVRDAAWLRNFVGTLTDRHERDSASPWQVSDAQADYIEQMLSAIVGLEIAIDSLSGKWKLSQNRSAADRAGVVSALAASRDPAAREMAALVAHPDRDPRG